MSTRTLYLVAERGRVAHVASQDTAVMPDGFAWGWPECATGDQGPWTNAKLRTRPGRLPVCRRCARAKGGSR